jgi:hypothetical protein
LRLRQRLFECLKTMPGVAFLPFQPNRFYAQSDACVPQRRHETLFVASLGIRVHEAPLGKEQHYNSILAGQVSQQAVGQARAYGHRAATWGLGLRGKDILPDLQSDDADQAQAAQSHQNLPQNSPTAAHPDTHARHEQRRQEQR